MDQELLSATNKLLRGPIKLSGYCMPVIATYIYVESYCYMKVPMITISHYLTWFTRLLLTEGYVCTCDLQYIQRNVLSGVARISLQLQISSCVGQSNYWDSVYMHVT